MTEQRITRRDNIRYDEHDEPATCWTLVIDDQVVSELWVNQDGEIVQVETLVAHQGRGYATALYRQAAQEMAIYHAPTGHRTPAGDAFAASVGGPVAEIDCDCHGCTYTGNDFDEE